MNGFSAKDRVVLIRELRDELYDLIHEHGRIATLTTAEVIGVLEILKLEIIAEQNDDDFEDDDIDEEEDD